MAASSNFLSAIRELESSINGAPLDEISDVLAQNLGLDPFEGVKEDLSDSLDDLMTYAKVGKVEAIRELVSIANQITKLLHNGHGFTAPTFEDFEEKSHEASWREKVDESAELILEEETSFLEKALGSVELTYPEGHHVFPPLGPPRFVTPPSLLNNDLEHSEETEEAEETEEDEEDEEVEEARKLEEDREIKTRLVAELIGRLMQTRLNQNIERSFTKIASASDAWPVSFTCRDAYFFRDKLPPDTLPKAFALNHFTKSLKCRRDGPVDFTLAIFEALDEERSKRYSPKHLQDLRIDDDRERQDDDFDHIRQLAKDEKPSALKETRVVGRYDETSGLIVDSEGRSIARPTLSSVWRRKAALLPPLEKGTVAEWVSAALFYLGYCCNGQLENQKWPQTVDSASRKFKGIRPGIRNILKQGLETISEIFSQPPSSDSQD